MRPAPFVLLLLLPLGPLAATEQSGCAPTPMWPPPASDSAPLGPRLSPLDLTDAGALAADKPAQEVDPWKHPWLDAGTHSTDLQVEERSTDAGTATETSQSAPGPGEVVITEIMNDSAATPDLAGEWLEIHNPSRSISYDLRGCELHDSGRDAHQIASPLVLPPGAFVTLASRGLAAAGLDHAPDYVYANFRLANADDEVLLHCGGELVDAVVYGPSFGFPGAPGASMSLDPGAFDARSNDIGANWCASPESSDRPADRGGTPAAVNPPCPP